MCIVPHARTHVPIHDMKGADFICRKLCKIVISLRGHHIIIHQHAMQAALNGLWRRGERGDMAH